MSRTDVSGAGAATAFKVEGGYRRPRSLWQNVAMSWAHQLNRPSRVNLEKFDPSDTAGLDKASAKLELEKWGEEFDELEDLMYFAGEHSLLIVLQGMDAAGKDGLIRCLLKEGNSQGGHVWPFKVPSADELAHDYLWRVHQRTPQKGGYAIFNRSHYEDVLVVRVHNLVPKERWSLRYDQINDFEKLLAENNTIIAKFFLHIDKKEQEERLLEREQEVEKAWKLSVGDWKEREHWDSYQEAYEDVLGQCSQPHAPWYIVPANKKWFRDVAVVRTLVETLRPYKKGWLEKLEREGEAAKAELAAYRSAQG